MKKSNAQNQKKYRERLSKILELQKQIRELTLTNEQLLKQNGDLLGLLKSFGKEK